MNVSLLTMESYDNRKENSVGSSRIRGRWIIDNWKECKAYEIGDNPDVMIYQKAYWKEHMKDFKGLKIFDLCDPDFLDGSPIKEVSSYVDAFVVPTETLQKALKFFVDKPIYVIKDRFDLNIFPKPKLNHKGVAKYIIWYGYSSNAYVLDKAMPYLNELDMELTVYSDKRVSVESFIKYDWNSFHEDALDYDIALLPRGDNPRFKYKSENKTIEMQLLGLPVAQDYDDLVKFKSPIERTKEAKAKYKLAKNNYDIMLSVKEWKQVIKELA